MTLKFKNQLKGERLILKITKPSIKEAEKIFKVIEENRKHIKPWLPWVNITLTVEDELKYLFDKEEQTKKGKKVEYGIYINKEYIGNIGIFDIDITNKSAEIGYWLSSKHIKKGYMSEAVRIVEKEFFENIKLNRIQIKCDEKNDASSGVAKKCNYKFEGLIREDVFSEYNKKFRNTLIFSKLKSEYKK